MLSTLCRVRPAVSFLYEKPIGRLLGFFPQCLFQALKKKHTVFVPRVGRVLEGSCSTRKVRLLFLRVGSMFRPSTPKKNNYAGDFIRLRHSSIDGIK